MRQPKETAAVGVAEHGNSAELVTATPSGKLLDRRRIDLTHDLPTHPHHHQGSWAVGRYLNTPGARAMPIEDAVRLVERVRGAAERGARESLERVASEVSVPILCISLRVCPELPATIEECIRDNRAQTYADTVMYRRALADAAVARSWSVFWYDPDSVFLEAGRVLDCDDIDAFLKDKGRELGPPWQARHKLAAAAAIAANRPRRA